MPHYFMRDTPLQALEQLMMSQPGQKPRGGGIYRSCDFPVLLIWEHRKIVPAGVLRQQPFAERFP